MCVLFMYACLYVCVCVCVTQRVDENIITHILFKAHQRTSGLSVAQWNCLFLSQASCNRGKGSGALVCRMKGSRLAMCVSVRVYHCIPFLIQLNSPPLEPTPSLPPCPSPFHPPPPTALPTSVPLSHSLPSPVPPSSPTFFFLAVSTSHGVPPVSAPSLSHNLFLCPFLSTSPYLEFLGDYQSESPPRVSL